MADDTPSYYKLNLNAIQGANKALPPVQAAKLLYAQEMLFFYGTELEDLGLALSKTAEGIYERDRQLILGYRRNALNGSKNKQTRQARNQKSREKMGDFLEENEPVFSEEIDQEF